MKEVEIFHGDIGSVKNELNFFLKKVRKIISITHSISNLQILTVILIYIPYIECPEDIKYKPNGEQYI